jgi:anti-sigma factor RsiW
MNCDAQALFSELIDGELPDDVRDAVEAHVGECADCARELRALRRTVYFVRANGPVDIAPGTPGAMYEDFHRALMDEAYGRAPLQVLFEALGQQPQQEKEVP